MPETIWIVLDVLDCACGIVDILVDLPLLILAVGARILDGFDDPRVEPARWEEMLRATNTDIVYLTWHWQRAWWEAFGEGDLLLIAAERNSELVALAPFYTRWGMVYFVGSERQADYLDFIGDVGDPEVLDAILETARARVPGFQGFELNVVSDSSATGKRLQEAGRRLGLACYDEWGEAAAAPALDLTGRGEVARAAANRKSVLKDERFFCREGSFEVRHFRDGEAILPQLREFFEQHIARRAATPCPSSFLKQPQRAFYERLTRLAAHAGWLRFTRVDWKGRPIAFHFGFCYRGRYFWNRPAFAPDLARRSPGHVLLRQLLLAAIEEGARTFDFGLGREAFKFDYATHCNYVRKWGLYPA